jgi:hypothetical protein
MSLHERVQGGSGYQAAGLLDAGAMWRRMSPGTCTFLLLLK